MSIENILEVCRTIKHDRDIESAFKHLNGEMIELKDEISAVLNDQSPNEDGVIGEAVDCILCLVDIIYQANKTVSVSDINSIIAKKLDKWNKVYSSDTPSVKTQVQILDERMKAMKVSNFNAFPGTEASAVTKEEFAAEINRVFDALESGLIKAL